MYAIYGNIYHQYTPNVSIYTIHGSYGYVYAGDIVILYHPFSTAKKNSYSHPKAAPRPVGLLDTLEVHEPQVSVSCRDGFFSGFYQGKW